MTIAELMGSRPWVVAGWTMLHVLWAGGLVGLFAAVLRLALRHARPEARYAAALSCLLAMSLLPAVVAARLARSSADEPSPAIAAGPAIAATPQAPSPGLTPAWEPEALPVVASRPVAGWGERLRPAMDRLAAALPWVWAGGSPATFALLALGLVGAERLRRESRRLGDGGSDGDEVGRLARRLGESLGIARRVGVGLSERVATPILVGVLRPLILLPSAALAGWSPEQLEMVLLHELAHVRRWDNLVNLAQRVAESVLFFHPAVWWISGWARLERELCCDALVVARTGRRRPYAELLVSLASPRPAAHASAAAAHPLVARIRLILVPEVPPMKLHRTAIAIAASLTLVPALLIGVTMPGDAAADDPKSPPPATPAPRDGDRDVLRRALEVVARSARPDDVHALRSLARVQFEAGDRDAGRETFRRAIDVARKESKPVSRVYGLLFVAQSQTAMGEKDAARETARQAVAATPDVIDPSDRVAVLAFAATVQVKAGDRPGGEETLAQAIALHEILPDRDPGGGNLNLRLTARHRVVEALVELGELGRAVEIAAADPDSINISLGHLPAALAKLKDRDRARAILRRVLEIAAQSRFPGVRGQALAEVAEARAKLGDFDEAVATARRLADDRLNANHLSSALRAVAAAEAAAGRRDEAHALLREALDVAKRQDPTMRASLAQFIARAQAETGDLAGARRSIAAIGDAYPSDRAEALVALAVAQAGDRRAALETLGQAVEAAGRIGPRADIGNFDPAWTRSYVFHHIAVAQAKMGDFTAALATLRDRTGDEFYERANGLNDVVEVQIASGDLKGALRTALALKVDDFRAGVGVEAVARAQARSGDAAGVLAWAEEVASPYVKARALVGMIRGLAERKEPPGTTPGAAVRP